MNPSDHNDQPWRQTPPPGPAYQPGPNDRAVPAAGSPGKRGWKKHAVGYAAVLIFGVAIGSGGSDGEGSTTVTPAAETVTVEAAPEIITEEITEVITEEVTEVVTEEITEMITETIEVTATETVEVAAAPAPFVAQVPASPTPTPAAPAPAAPAPAPPAPAPAPPANTADCVIKGNISSSGEKIYHVPGQQFYDATKIDITKGERWFCTEQDAVNAGWRKSLR